MLALIGLVVGFSSPKAPGTTVQQAPKAWVDDDDPTCGGNSPCFQRIQAAIDAIQLEPYQSGTVYIRPGLYREHVQITKNIELQGAGRELVRLEASDPTKPAILVKGTYMGRLSGLRILGGSVGILLEDAEVSEIKYNGIANNSETGIRLIRSKITLSIAFNELLDYFPKEGLSTVQILDGSYALIGLNTIRSYIEIECENSYAKIEGNTLGGVTIKDGAANISSNQLIAVSSVGWGVELVQGEAIITGNNIQGHDIGINLRSGRAYIERNLIRGNNYGIIAGDPVHPSSQPPWFRVVRNQIIGNAMWGLALYQGGYLIPSNPPRRTEVYKNWILGNGTADGQGGVIFDQQVRLELSNNWIIGNFYGVEADFDKTKPIDMEALTGSDNEIRDNERDLHPPDYPWPPGFRK
jgi:hypothetical protein